MKTELREERKTLCSFPLKEMLPRGTSGGSERKRDLTIYKRKESSFFATGSVAMRQNKEERERLLFSFKLTRTRRKRERTFDLFFFLWATDRNTERERKSGPFLVLLGRERKVEELLEVKKNRGKR